MTRILIAEDDLEITYLERDYLESWKVVKAGQEIKLPNR